VDGFQAGISYLAYSSSGLKDRPDQIADRAAALGVTSVAVVVPIFQDHPEGTRVYVIDGATPSDEELTALIGRLRERGLAVTLRPLMDEGALHKYGKWRGLLEPSNRAAWFKSYGDLVERYAKLAERLNVEGLTVGVEFTSLENSTDLWVELIRRARAHYSGAIVYSANWPRPGAQPPAFLKEVDVIGIDAFYPLNVPNDARAEQLKAAWQPWLRGMEAFVASFPDKRLWITELGTTSQRGSFKEPATWNHKTPRDLDAQRRYYEASCAALRAMPLVTGIFWWALYPELPTDPIDESFSPLGKPAEQEITRCFKP
jgi:hypothetical protein